MVGVEVGVDAGAVGDFAGEDLGGEFVEDEALDDALEGARAERGVVALAREFLGGGVGHFEPDVLLGEESAHAPDLDFHDLAQLRRCRGSGTG